jgi:hypothetical protein
MNKGEVNRDFWEKAWGKSPLTAYTGIEKYLATNVKLDRLFKKFLPKGKRKVLEICRARGKHLIYFAR